MDEAALRAQLAALGASLFARGYSVGTAGNISVRLPDGFLMTPTNSCLGRLEPATRHADLHRACRRARHSQHRLVA
jgi:ribulose-5-phosphate 4-epimerase/fuculose-1-phosphate aldolase